MDGHSQESAKWHDVTELFLKAASQMSNLQPMVHTDTFSLHDSMAAVEVRLLGLTGASVFITTVLTMLF